MPRPFDLILLLATCLMGASCSGSPFTGSDKKVCTAIFIRGIHVTITDSVSGAAIPAQSILTYLSLGMVVRKDTVTSNFNPVMVALDYPATYDVIVERPGYRAWEARGVSIESADDIKCHPKTVFLNAKLQPTS
ncbi:MAG: hypothetical protein JWO05_1001 [Gemmatimonadetes bacterium]|nr:hypothetical protein [Gemmatimonadota bacterium]